MSSQNKLNQFIEKSMDRFKDKFDYSKVNYINNTTKINIICKKHGSQLITPTEHFRLKTGCQQCQKEEIDSKNRLKFINKSKMKFGNKFDYSKVKYPVSEKITLICKDHNYEFKIDPYQHTHSKYGGCKFCTKEFNNSKHTNIHNLNKIKFIEQANKKFNNKFDYSKMEYIDRDAKVVIICPKHGEFKITPNNHINSSGGCPKCNDQIKINNLTNEFIRKSKMKFGDAFNYSKVKYINSNTDIILICKKHGEFITKPTLHLQSKYGCNKCAREYISETFTLSQEEFLEKAKDVHGDRYDYSNVKYTSMSDKIEIICKEHGSFMQQAQQHIHSGDNCPKCSDVISISNAEKELSKFLTNYNINHICSDRNIIHPKEIDILIPGFKIGIEYNGLLFHSYGLCYPNNFSEMNKKYHLVKTEMVEDKEFQLFHIFENEWLDSIKKNIWLSLLRNKLGLIPKDNIVYARKCHIREVSNAEAITFQNQNHLQGYRSASIKLGLYYNNVLISLMTFGKPVFSKNYEYELIRFCSKINYRVIGGASKLLKYFEKKYNPISIVTYANRRWSIGNLYEKLGFTFLHNSEPNYFYIRNNKLYSRNSFQKHMLKDKLELFDNNMTELQNMMNNKYRVIYDCGNKVYSKEYK